MTPHRRYPWSPCALLLSLLGCSLPSCGSDSRVQNPKIYVIVLPGAPSAPPAGDIASVELTVSDSSTHRPLLAPLPLSKDNDGHWATPLPSLPEGMPLAFEAHAFGAGSPPQELYTGTTFQTLIQNQTHIAISLAPKDSTFIAIPRITRIIKPGLLDSGESRTVSVALEATSNEPLTFTAEAAAGGGKLSPAGGTITFPSTTATLVIQYEAPDVPTNTDFIHHITLTNARGVSIRTSFTTRVLRREVTTQCTSCLLPRAEFPPVIDSLIGRPAPPCSPTELQLTAQMRDDTAGRLAYQWAFTSDPSVTPAPYFAYQGASTAILRNYSYGLSGTLRLDVTDADSNTTTLSDPFRPIQYIVDPCGPGQPGLVGLTAGGNHTCALETNGNVRCWGRGDHGQLGYGNPNNLGVSPATLPKIIGDVPQLVDPTEPYPQVAQVAAGYEHTCILYQNGQVTCWGNNTYGQLGYGTHPGSAQNVGDDEPATQYGYANVGGNVLRIAAGGDHTCVLVDTGGATPGVRCWGRNDSGQLGYGAAVAAAFGSNNGDDEQPYLAGDVELTNLNGATVTDIQAGRAHTCVLLSDGNVRCWGQNTDGQLGLGSTSPQTTPPATNLPLPPSQNVRQLAAGAYHTCALLSNGQVRCWGRNDSGQLGFATGDQGHYSGWGDAAGETPATATDVPLGGLQALQVVAGAHHSCAILTTGDVRCWGQNDAGQLGNPAQASSNSVTINLPTTGISIGAGSTSAVRLTAGSAHTCALLSTGFVTCWGLGAYGQLGYGNTNDIGDNETPAAAGNVPLR
ncbi:MAG TPA: RTX toxin [Polyangia bacterium]|jgi:alpha-tubulin suppressor-like RCC1 family protein|nr:RTX toxin [Polyangia bacterium]